jgi:HK97 family phage major capsid protein
MYEETCQHGYLAGSCAECRHRRAYGEHSEIVSPTGDPVGERFERYLALHKDGQRAGWLTRRTEITAELAQLENYARRSNAQEAQLGELTGELTVLSSLIDQDDVRVRSEKIEAIKRAAQDPANLERPIGYTGGGPALVSDRRSDRLERPAEVIQRMRSNPWRDETGPLAHRVESAAGLVARAHAAIEGQSKRLTHDGAEKLAKLLSPRPSTFGPYELRTQEDIARSAELVVALSNPWYESAFRHILRAPMEFRGGTGMLRWNDEERQAYVDVVACRAALIENTGTGGAYLLPLYLDPSIMLTNAGAASPWRRVCRGVQTTSNTWNGVTSAGVTAGWLAEGTVSSDNTPTLGQLVITPQKEAQWIMASFEEVADSDISAQVPALIADAFDRLEEAAFVTGTGSGQPFGAITRATVDGSTGLVNAASAVSVFSLLSNLPVRFRVYEHAKPYWMANIAVINLLRALTAFASATNAVVNDNTPDGVPEMFGIDLLESTTMDGSNAVGGHKNLLIFDASSYLICDRIGTTVIYEPLVPGTGGINPAGINGWFAYRRVGADTPTATALRVHNNA